MNETIQLSADKRSVALADLDHTLLLALNEKIEENFTLFLPTNETDELQRYVAVNIDLLDALAAKKVKDIIPFTDMTFNYAFLTERKQLISLLINRGFNVPCCITPLDYFWHIDHTELEKFAQRMGMLDIRLKKGMEKNIDKLGVILEEFPWIQTCVDSENHPPVGIAYADATDPDKPLTKERLAFLGDHSYFCKNAIDLLSYLKKLRNCKALMCLQFLQHLPAWVSECYVFDDNEDNINAVKECKTNTITIHTFHGMFNEQGDSFIEAFSPTFFGSRLTQLINSSLIYAKEQQARKVSLGKKDFNLELDLYAKALNCDSRILDIWSLILGHLQKTKKNVFKNYQFTPFETQLMKLIATNRAICQKLKITMMSAKTFDPSQFLDAIKKKPNLSASMDTGLPDFSIRKNGRARPRSASMRLKSTSLELPHLDTLYSDMHKSTSTDTLKLERTLNLKPLYPSTAEDDKLTHSSQEDSDNPANSNN